MHLTEFKNSFLGQICSSTFVEEYQYSVVNVTRKPTSGNTILPLFKAQACVCSKQGMVEDAPRVLVLFCHVFLFHF